MTRGTREKESASRELEEPDIAEERLTDRAEANHLALIRMAKWFANVLSVDSCDKANGFSRTERSPIHPNLQIGAANYPVSAPALTVDPRYTAQRVRNLVLSVNLFHAQMIKTAAVLRC